jgi:hypothetical protein
MSVAPLSIAVGNCYLRITEVRRAKQISYMMNENGEPLRTCYKLGGALWRPRADYDRP